VIEQDSADSADSADFGFERVRLQEKTRRVGEVFGSVASRYDLMNDLMSLGIHRAWKRYAIHVAQIKPGAHILDVAGGTGDMSAMFHQAVGEQGLVIVSDINNAMLNEGRDRLLDKGVITGLQYVQANAEALPFKRNSFDCVCIAFGLRNVTDKNAALRSMFDKIKYGGSIVILEFSTVVLPFLKQLYETYSFEFIPRLGQLIANDKDSYRYLVESISMHPDQDALKDMMEAAGFSRVDYYNLTGGIVAVHKGYKL
jgi:demethylmenaquinone methyltransferase/2-methoxy-6-polyprenyl-1,4-benzoquinol methylase